jgi:hypothetical protein
MDSTRYIAAVLAWAYLYQQFLQRRLVQLSRARSELFDVLLLACPTAAEEVALHCHASPQALFEVVVVSKPTSMPEWLPLSHLLSHVSLGPWWAVFGIQAQAF